MEKQWYNLFIDTYRTTGLLSKACQAAGITTSMVHKEMARNPDFKDNVEEALFTFNESLEEAAISRAVDGVDSDIYNGKGERIGTKTTYSDTLLVKLLEARQPEKFGKKVQVDTKTPLVINVAKFTEEPLA